jgi:hypothetical protein
MDHAGRERRYKYFTVAQYNTLATKEGFPASQNRYHGRVDAESVMQFSPVDPCLFYTTEEDVLKHVDDLAGRLATDTVSNKPKKVKQYKNPILPDGTVKKGRPRKNPDLPPRKGRAPGEPPRKRGRPSKKQPEEPDDVSAGEAEAGPSRICEESQGQHVEIPTVEPSIPQKRKRSRALEGKGTRSAEELDEDPVSISQIRTRGKPRTSSAGLHYPTLSQRLPACASQTEPRLSDFSDGNEHVLPRSITNAPCEETGRVEATPGQRQRGRPSRTAKALIGHQSISGASVVPEPLEKGTPSKSVLDTDSPTLPISGSRRRPIKRTQETASVERPVDRITVIQAFTDGSVTNAEAGDSPGPKRREGSKQVTLSELWTTESTAPSTVVTCATNASEEAQESTNARDLGTSDRLEQARTAGERPLTGRGVHPEKPLPKRRGRPPKRKKPDEAEIEDHDRKSPMKRARHSENQVLDGVLSSAGAEGSEPESHDVVDSGPVLYAQKGQSATIEHSVVALGPTSYENVGPSEEPRPDVANDQPLRRSPRKTRPTGKALESQPLPRGQRSAGSLQREDGSSLQIDEDQQVPRASASTLPRTAGRKPDVPEDIVMANVADDMTVGA